MFHTFRRMGRKGLQEASIMTKAEGGGGGKREGGIKMIFFFKKKSSRGQLESDKTRAFR